MDIISVQTVLRIRLVLKPRRRGFHKCLAGFHIQAIAASHLHFYIQGLFESIVFSNLIVCEILANSAPFDAFIYVKPL